MALGRAEAARFTPSRHTDSIVAQCTVEIYPDLVAKPAQAGRPVPADGGSEPLCALA